MWSCAQNRKHLNAYMDGELPERSCCEVEAHLAECSGCRREFDQLLRLAPILANDDLPQVPAGLSKRIVSEAASRQRRKEAGKPAAWGWRTALSQPWLIQGVTTVALILGLTMGALMGWTSYLRPDSGQWMTTNEDMAKHMYAFDVLGAEPRGSIEAATLALLDDER